MVAIRSVVLRLLAGFVLTLTTGASAAVSYSFVEGYNVLDTNNAPTIGANYAATAGQERDIAVDAARGIIYMARGSTTTADGRSSGVAGVSAIVVTNGARLGSNFRDTGLITAASPAVSFHQSLAYDPGSDKLWVFGGGAVSTPVIFSAPGGTLGGAPTGDNPSAVNAALTKAFQVDTNLLDVGVYVPGTNGLPARSGQPRGFAVRTLNGTNTTVYLGMGNHVQAWANDQPLVNTNSPWRRIWATQRPPAQNTVSTRVIASFSGVNGLAVDDDGNCYFNVYPSSPGRIWTVRPGLIQFALDPMSLDFNDLAFGGTNEREIIPLIVTPANNVPVNTNPNGITFCRFGAQKTLFVSYVPGVAQRAVTRMDIDNGFSFTNGGAYLPARAIDGFGSGQSASGQDSILSSIRLKQSAAGQPQGTSNNLLYHDVDSVTNPTYLFAEAFVVDTNKGQTIPTAAVIKILLPVNTNPPSITTQPQSQTLLEGGTISLSVVANGLAPLHYQWQTNSADISGANSSGLTIVPASTNNSGSYRVIITNILGSITSSVVQVTVDPLVRSTAMTPLWSLAPGSRYYLATDNNQRGLAYSPLTTDLLVVSRTPTNSIHVLSSEDGSELFQLRTDPGVISGGTFSLNAIGCSDDGKTYAGNLAQNGETFRIYRWDSEESTISPVVAYSGNPTSPLNNRWGDSFDVRGSENGIQILTGTRSSNVVAIFTTADGGASFAPTVITVPGAPGGSFGLGVAFAGPDTFWAKGDSLTALRLVQFDLANGTGVVLRTYSSPGFPGVVSAIGVQTNLNVLAGVSIENPDNLRLFDISDLASGPRLVDQELFATDNDNINATGAIDFSNDKVFALDSNNGIIALTLGSIPPAGPGRIYIARGAGNVTLTWTNNFILQSSLVVTGIYTDLTGPTNSYSESVSNAPQKYFKLRN